MATTSPTSPPAEAKFEAWRDALLASHIPLPAGHPDIGALLGWLKSAYAWAEGLTGRTLLTASMVAALDQDDFELNANGNLDLTRVFLPRGPVRTISTVKTFDADDASTTVPAANYRLEGKPTSADYAEWPYLVAVGAGWTLSRQRHAMEVAYDAGYGAAHADLPENLRLAVERKTFDIFRNRSDAITGTVKLKSPVTAGELISDFIVKH